MKKTPLHVAKLKRRAKLRYLYGAADPEIARVRFQYLSALAQLKAVDACYIPAYRLTRFEIELTDEDIQLAKHDSEIAQVLTGLIARRFDELRRG